MANEYSEVTTEFLEKILNCKVLDFTISQGTQKGDNYLGLLIAIDVTVETKDGGTEKKHLICKCYPQHPARQEFNNGENIFYNELHTYKQWFPALVELKNRFMPDAPPLPYAPFIAGEAVNYKQLDQSQWKKHYGPFENFIMMTDVRKQFGYHMEDRTKGLSETHIFLVMKELARVHAFSWVYKQINKLNKITDHFPFLCTDQTQQSKDMFAKLIESNVQMVMDAVKNKVPVEAIKGWERLRTNVEGIQSCYYTLDATEKLEKVIRIPSKEKFKDVVSQIDTESAWSIVCHGDSWMNNMLFKNNSQNEPESVILVDFQICFETCPTTDLAYFIYSGCGLPSERRKVILNDLLKTYYDSFIKVCIAAGCDPLPGFSIDALRYRMYRKSIFGATMASLLYPVMLLDSKDTKDLDKDSSTTGDMCDMLKSVTDSVFNSEGTKFSKAMIDLTMELYEAGAF